MLDAYDLLIGEETYKLRLTTRQTIELEEDLKENPIQMVIRMDEGELPNSKDIAKVLFHSLQSFHREEFRTVKNVYELMDRYFDEENSDLYTLFGHIVKSFQTSGLIPKNNENDEEKK